MPMIDVTLPEGALTDEAKAELVEGLTATLIELEGAPDNEYVRAVTWCFVDERPAGSCNVGGRPGSKPIYRITLTTPEGAPGIHGPIAAVNREELVRRVTALVLDAEETANEPAEACRVWVQIREIPDGYWGGFGTIARLEDIGTLAGLPPLSGPTSRGEGFRRAIEAAAADLSTV